MTTRPPRPELTAANIRSSVELAKHRGDKVTDAIVEAALAYAELIDDEEEQVGFTSSVRRIPMRVAMQSKMFCGTCAHPRRVHRERRGEWFCVDGCLCELFVE